MKQIYADGRQLVALTGSNDQHGLYQVFTIKATVRDRTRDQSTRYEGVADEFRFEYARHDFMKASQAQMDERLRFVESEVLAKIKPEQREVALLRGALEIQNQMFKRAVLVDDGERVLVRFPDDASRVCTIHKLDNTLYHTHNRDEVMNNDPIFIELTPTR